MLVRVPSAGSYALNDGAQTIVNSGTCSRYASWPARRPEHVADEQAVPRLLGDDAQRKPVLRLRARVEVLDEQVATLEEAGQPAEDLLELAGPERAVVLAPPDLILGRRLADDELVLRGARGVLACVDHDRAAGDDPALAAKRDLLVQRLRRQVPVDAARVRDAVVLQRRSRLRARAPAPCAGVFTSSGLKLTASPSPCGGRRCRCRSARSDRAPSGSGARPRSRPSSSRSSSAAGGPRRRTPCRGR